MGRIRTIADEVEEEAPAGELALLAFPVESFRALSTAAAQRNMTIYQLLARALDHYLKATEPSSEGE
jgi:hypothetical protein